MKQCLHARTKSLHCCCPQMATMPQAYTKLTSTTPPPCVPVAPQTITVLVGAMSVLDSAEHSPQHLADKQDCRKASKYPQHPAGHRHGKAIVRMASTLCSCGVPCRHSQLLTCTDWYSSHQISLSYMVKVIITCCDPPWLLHPLCFTQLQGYLSTPSCCQDHLQGAYLWLDGCCSVKAIGIKRSLPLEPTLMSDPCRG